MLTISGKTTGYYEITYNDKTYRPYEAGEGKEHIFLPVKIDDAGNKTIIIKDIVGGNTSGQKAASIKVARRKIQAIKLMESDEKMRAAEPMVESQNDLVLKTLHTKTDARLWTKGFIPPVKTKISTKFAQLRKATTYQYYHKGIDYSASVGTQVKAVNSGKIIFARSGLSVYGNIMMIDHGQGVVSCYFHLNKFLKQEGDTVARGSGGRNRQVRLGYGPAPSLRHLPPGRRRRPALVDKIFK